MRCSWCVDFKSFRLCGDIGKKSVLVKYKGQYNVLLWLCACDNHVPKISIGPFVEEVVVMCHHKLAKLYKQLGLKVPKINTNIPITEYEEIKNAKRKLEQL